MNDRELDPRDADESELDHLAKLWYDGWQDAHAALMPAELRRLRTLANFRDRLRAGLEHVRVIGPRGAPAGFSMLKGDELYQFYVSAEARGTGVAPALIADAEARLAANGVATAWLGCAIGNERASGWRRVRTEQVQLDTFEGPFPLEVWRFEKTIARE
jgi:GNAT superfamily N-acetyltransferase